MEYYCEICEQKIEQDEWEKNDCLCNECFDEEFETAQDLEDRT